MTKLIALNDEQIKAIDEMFAESNVIRTNEYWLELSNALQKDIKAGLIEKMKQIKVSDGRYLQDSTGIINDAIKLIKEF